MSTHRVVYWMDNFTALLYRNVANKVANKGSFRSTSTLRNFKKQTINQGIEIRGSKNTFLSYTFLSFA
jgi:hypothetical protein